MFIIFVICFTCLIQLTYAGVILARIIGIQKNDIQTKLLLIRIGKT